MTDIPDELVNRAVDSIAELIEIYVNRGSGLSRSDLRTDVRPILEAVGLPALLERVEAAEADKDLFLFERDRARGQRDDLFEEAMTVRSQRDALAAKVARVEALARDAERRTGPDLVDATDRAWGRNLRAALTDDSGYRTGIRNPIGGIPHDDAPDAAQGNLAAPSATPDDGDTP